MGIYIEKISTLQDNCNIYKRCTCNFQEGRFLFWLEANVPKAFLYMLCSSSNEDNPFEAPAEINSHLIGMLGYLISTLEHTPIG